MTGRGGRTALLALATSAALGATSLLAGCERTLKDMYVQPRLGPDAASPLFADGKSSRPPVPGTEAVAMGELAMTSSGRHGREELVERRAADAAQTMPAPTLALLRRGQERFDIDCAPCHSPLGDGDGMIARRGFPHPPSFHQARLRAAPDRQFFDVITRGYGAMPSLGDRATPQDRWAIVAYVRALQLSQDASATALPPDLRAALARIPEPVSTPSATPASAPSVAPTSGASDPETR